MLNHLLTFAIFLVIGIEIREGLTHLRALILPTFAALGGMVAPALIFLLINNASEGWATVMPTDVALAIGALSILGSRISPAVKIFLMTLAVADDFFSLMAMGIFFRNQLDIASAFYTLGAAAIGALLPFRKVALKYLAPTITFLIVPIYIWINLFAKMDLSHYSDLLSISVIIARVIGKVVGISVTIWALNKWSALKLPANLQMYEVVGVGLFCGMGMTVSLVIADISVESEVLLNQIRSGLFISAIISALLGVLWFKRFPASL